MARNEMDPNDPARVYSEAAIEWGRRRAREMRRNDINIDTRLNYEPIVFPDADGCRHAALVVCSYAKDAADAKAILEALALPTIMRDGGDGRQIRVQRGKVTMAAKREDPRPLGFHPDDYGRPEERKKRGKR